MNSTKHTPGPWAPEGEVKMVGDPYSTGGAHMLYVGAVEVAGLVGWICRIQSSDHCGEAGISRDEAQANALLIAAAPDLLEALAPFCRATLTQDGSIVGLMREDFERAATAFAKATGGKA
jgi:hypothetical protein